MKRKRYSLVAVAAHSTGFTGGGQRRLLDEAFRVGETVMIGVTSDDSSRKGEDIEPCRSRMKNL